MKKLAIIFSFFAIHMHGMDLMKDNDQTQIVKNKSGQKVRIEIQQTNQAGTKELLSNLHPNDSVTLTAEKIDKLRIVIKDSDTNAKLLSREFLAADIVTIKTINNKLDIQATIVSNKPEIKTTQEKYDSLKVAPRITRKKSQQALMLAQKYNKLEATAQKTLRERVSIQQPTKDPNHRKIESISNLFTQAKK